METTPRRLSHDEIGRRAEEIYARIKPEEDPENIGKFLMVDVESGDFEIDTDSITPCDRLRERHPEAIIFCFRIGYVAAYSFKAGGMKRRAS